MKAKAQCTREESVWKPREGLACPRTRPKRSPGGRCPPSCSARKADPYVNTTALIPTRTKAHLSFPLGFLNRYISRNPRSTVLSL